MKRALIIILLAVGLASCGTDSDSATKSKATPQATPRTSWGRVQRGMRERFGKSLMSLDRANRKVAVRVEASDNFSNGLIRTGIKDDAGRAFEVVHDAGYPALDVTIDFYFPLVDKTTGKESKDVVASYSIDKAELGQITWDNFALIDWDQYRTMIHPALQS